MALSDLFFGSDRRVPLVWHKNKFHSALHKPVPQMKRDVLYAYQLGVLTAARAAHGVTNQWQGIDVIPLANADEIHALWVTPPDLDYRQPIGVRWGLLPNNASSALTITTTYDAIDTGANHAGSGVTGDGATALSQTIAAVANADTTAETPFFSQIGTIEELTTDFDLLFLKLVASGQAAADRLRVFCLEIYYVPRTS